MPTGRFIRCLLEWKTIRWWELIGLAMKIHRIVIARRIHLPSLLALFPLFYVCEFFIIIFFFFFIFRLCCLVRSFIGVTICLMLLLLMCKMNSGVKFEPDQYRRRCLATDSAANIVSNMPRYWTANKFKSKNSNDRLCVLFVSFYYCCMCEFVVKSCRKDVEKTVIHTYMHVSCACTRLKCDFRCLKFGLKRCFDYSRKTKAKSNREGKKHRNGEKWADERWLSDGSISFEYVYLSVLSIFGDDYALEHELIVP